MIKFELSEEHSKKAREWIDTHECPLRGKYQGAIGGAITFMFTDTSIGQLQTVSCACKQQLLLNGDDL